LTRKKKDVHIIGQRFFFYWARPPFCYILLLLYFPPIYYYKKKFFFFSIGIFIQQRLLHNKRGAARSDSIRWFFLCKRTRGGGQIFFLFGFLCVPTFLVAIFPIENNFFIFSFFRYCRIENPNTIKARVCVTDVCGAQMRGPVENKRLGAEKLDLIIHCQWRR
jgi:hypothetical protein